MSMFVESLKRLYENGKIKDNKISTLLIEKKITKEEYNYILGK